MSATLLDRADKAHYHERREAIPPIDWHQLEQRGKGQGWDVLFGCMYRVLLDRNVARGRMEADEAEGHWLHYLCGVSVKDRQALQAKTPAQIEAGWHEWLRGLDARPLAEAIPEPELPTAGPAPMPVPLPLAPSVVAVLDLAAQGATRPQMAAVRGCSPKTIDSYLVQGRQFLGVERWALARAWDRWCAENGRAMAMVDLPAVQDKRRTRQRQEDG